MSESEDLFDKADALLGRYRGEPGKASEADFPILTEIVESPTIAAEAPAGKTMDALPHRAGISEEAAHEISRHLVETLRQSIDEALEASFGTAAMQHLQQEIGRVVQQVLTDAGARAASRIQEDIEVAVGQALTEMKAGKKNPPEPPRSGK
jgi:hypothetical protein